ncbi:alkaline phosphatase [Chryseobacterium sp. SN22]|uniref:alkaline phosphatase n=1 Tax=Chryseobacterium sp. SN22 TaxID=2606431 RepID=UPI0021D286DF
MMVEASKTDGGGHNSTIGPLMTELQDFDKIVGKAMKFPDEDKETLVAVLGDYETRKLSLLDGSLEESGVFGISAPMSLSSSFLLIAQIQNNLQGLWKYENF